MIMVLVSFFISEHARKSLLCFPMASKLDDCLPLASTDFYYLFGLVFHSCMFFLKVKHVKQILD